MKTLRKQLLRAALLLALLTAALTVSAGAIRTRDWDVTVDNVSLNEDGSVKNFALNVTLHVDDSTFEDIGTDMNAWLCASTTPFRNDELGYYGYYAQNKGSYKKLKVDYGCYLFGDGTGSYNYALERDKNYDRKPKVPYDRVVPKLYWSGNWWTYQLGGNPVLKTSQTGADFAENPRKLNVDSDSYSWYLIYAKYDRVDDYYTGFPYAQVNVLQLIRDSESIYSVRVGKPDHVTAYGGPLDQYLAASANSAHNYTDYKTVTLKADPGYKFDKSKLTASQSGLTLTLSEGDTVLTISGEPNADFTVKLPSLVSYSVAYNSMGGSAITPEMVKPVVLMPALPEEPTRKGYDFQGWFEDQSFTVTPRAEGAELNENVTLYAKWTPKNYTVTAYMTTGETETQDIQLYQNGATTGYTLEKTDEKDADGRTKYRCATVKTYGAVQTYDVWAGGKATGKTVTIDDENPEPVIIETGRVTVETRVDGTLQPISGKVSLVQDGAIRYAADNTTGTVVINGLAGTYDLYVAGADTGKDVTLSESLPVTVNDLGYFSVSVDITDDALWDTASVTLRVNGQAKTTISLTGTSGNTATYSAILPLVDGESNYELYVGAVDTLVTVKSRDNGAKTAALTFGTLTVKTRLDGALMGGNTVTLRRGSDVRTLTDTGTGSYTIDHVLISNEDVAQRGAWQIWNNNADSGRTLTPTAGRTAELDYWSVTFYARGDDGKYTTVHAVKQAADGLPTTPAAAPQLQGSSFLYWSQTKNGAEFDFSTPITSAIQLYPVYLTAVTQLNPVSQCVALDWTDGRVLDANGNVTSGEAVFTGELSDDLTTETDQASKTHIGYRMPGATIVGLDKTSSTKATAVKYILLSVENGTLCFKAPATGSYTANVAVNNSPKDGTPAADDPDVMGMAQVEFSCTAGDGINVAQAEAWLRKNVFIRPSSATVGGTVKVIVNGVLGA